MKKILLLLFLFIAGHGFATVCVDKVFKEKHLNLYLCQNHSNYNESRTQLYKVRATQLNLFIEDLIAQGKLEDKIFEIQIHDPVMGYEQSRVSQSSKAYYIYLREFAAFEKLARIVNYFAQEDWESFEYDPSTVQDRHATVQKFEEIISAYPLVDITTYISLNKVIWSLDDVQMKYSEDEFVYFYKNSKLPYAALYERPIIIQNRYLFFEDHQINILENGMEILKTDIERTEVYDEGFEIKVYPKWVNIAYGGRWVYSYSYDKNKLIKL